MTQEEAVLLNSVRNHDEFELLQVCLTALHSSQADDDYRVCGVLVTA